MKGSILLTVALLAGCGGDADVAGNYTIALNNGENGGNLSNFTPGQMTSGVGITVVQDGSKVTLTVEGGGGLALIALLGANRNVFTGDVDGDSLQVESLGTRANTSGNCTYTFNSTIDGNLDGDVLRGRISYRAADNGNSDCTQVHGCLSYQDYNGTRPPQ
ncbi:hypothetical protein BH11MYX3_BH11MYX3_12190 [soil metagenome]